MEFKEGEKEEVFNDLPEEGEEELEEKKEEKEGEDDDEDEEKKTSPVERKLNTLSRKYEKAVVKIQDLSDKLYKRKEEGKTLSDEEKKELQAQEYIKKQAKEALKELQKEKESEDKTNSEAFEEELDEVLDENPSITEKELLDVCEEYEISPRKALKMLKRLSKDTDKKDRPKMPAPKRGTAEVKEKDDPKKYEGKSFDERMSMIARESKEMVRKMLKK